jgi:hypothetical protein
VGAKKYLATAKGTSTSDCAAWTYKAAHDVNYWSTSSCIACTKKPTNNSQYTGNGTNDDCSWSCTNNYTWMNCETASSWVSVWWWGTNWNFTRQDLTLNQGWSSYTIMDRNLWATSVYTSWAAESTANTIGSSPFYWDYYQFWRNTTDWTNWSSSYSYDWKSPWWTDAWSANDWWVSNTYGLTMTYSDSTSANKTKMQWPCPSWRHVPTSAEWDWLFQAWCKYREWTSCTISAWSSSTWSSLWWSATLANFKSDLGLPLAGRRNRYDGSVINQGSYEYYWSSSPDGVYARGLRFYSFDVRPQVSSSRAYGFSVRCFKN